MATPVRVLLVADDEDDYVLTCCWITDLPGGMDWNCYGRPTSEARPLTKGQIDATLLGALRYAVERDRRPCGGMAKRLFKQMAIALDVPLDALHVAMGVDGPMFAAAELGFDVHLTKPVDPQNLVAVVDALCRAADSENVSQITHATNER